LPGEPRGVAPCPPGTLWELEQVPVHKHLPLAPVHLLWYGSSDGLNHPSKGLNLARKISR